MSRAPLVDAHHLGLGQTGNEAWSAGVVGALERSGGGMTYAVSAAGRLLLPPSARDVAVVSPRSAVRLLRDLPREVRRRRPPALLAHYTLPPVDVPSVLVVHDVSFEQSAAAQWIPRRSLWRYRASIRASARRADLVLTPSEHARADVLACFGLPEDRVRAVHNGVEPDLRAARDTTPRAARSLVVLCVGTVLPRKNLLTVARAVVRLREAGLAATLQLVGPVRPAGRPDLEEMQRLLGDALEVTGAVDRQTLVAAYRSAAVLAFPSRYEGFGLPVAEAMAAGTPVVASTASCLPEVVGGAGILAGPDDVEGWTTALRDVLTDPALADRLRASGVERAAQFSWDRVAQVVRTALEDAAR